MRERVRSNEGNVASQLTDHITPSDYTRFTNLIYSTCGIQLNASKQLMVETRLRKRLKETGAKTYGDYWKLLSAEDRQQEELIRLIDAITTNKTDFFREPAHFDHLVQQVLPELGPRLRAHRKPLRVWSAGCSTGKEPYTLAMVLKDCQRAGMIDEFSILATDICTEVLARASQAVYQEEDIEPIPETLRKKYLLKSRGPEASSFRIVPELRSTVNFERLNFMDTSYAVDGPFDIVFCRNVIIYFDRTTQEQVVNKLADCLARGGYFFTGHSETLSGLSTHLVSVAPTVYRKAKGK
jgi:chemotaxis protein methyltransferase CheR